MILGLWTGDHSRHGLPSQPAWQDSDGVHMAVPETLLLPAVRAVSEEPAAYVTLRTAATRNAAETLAAAPRGTDPTASGSYTLGSYDAVAEAVRQDLGEERAKVWQRDVVEGLTRASAEPPSYAADPAGHLVGSWLRTLRTGGAENSAQAFEEQSADLTDTWAKAVGLDERHRAALRRTALASASSSRDSALRTLGS
ncbi:hypothetical protein ACVNF4_04480 [Streptomyces sp. S6]